MMKSLEALAQDIEHRGSPVDESSLTETEKTKMLDDLGFDARPTKLVCILQRLPSKRLSVFLKHGIDIGGEYDFKSKAGLKR